MCPGWRFAEANEKVPGAHTEPDPLNNAHTHMRDIYFEQDANYEGRFTVPTLYDKTTKQIVNNESSEIIRMLYYAFDDLLPKDSPQRTLDLFPKQLRKQIEETNDWTYHDINNGVYKSGFATWVAPLSHGQFLVCTADLNLCSTQEAYEKNVTTLFKSLDRAEEHLRTTDGPYYYGEHITEADVRLFTTIIRFDVVYVQHFKVRPPLCRYTKNHQWSTSMMLTRDANSAICAIYAAATRRCTGGCESSIGTYRPLERRPNLRTSRVITPRATSRSTRKASHR